jgi:hypothetical protein
MKRKSAVERRVRHRPRKVKVDAVLAGQSSSTNGCHRPDGSDGSDGSDRVRLAPLASLAQPARSART